MRINEINTPIEPDTYEASMFIKQAIRAGKYAIKIHDLLSNDQEMESWVAKKIDLATGYIATIGHYMEGQEMTEDEYEPASREHYKKSLAAGYKGSYEDYKKEYGSFPDEFPQKNESVTEDAGEGHMSKSQLYAAAKYCLNIASSVRPGDDIEGWVQTKMNRAVDMLDAVYHYEDYQRLNPYREQLDSNILQQHSQIVQKNIDEILARETPINDTETKPGMLNILKKRVHEVEKKMCREYSKEKQPRQLKDPNKEVLVQKDGKVVTIDKNRKKEYLAKGWTLAENIVAERMPAQIIKNKQKLAMMTDRELADRFKDTDETTLRQMAWRHGYGKMSPHYWNRVQKGMTDLHYDDVLDTDLEEGLGDWAKKLAAAGIIVGTLAGVGSLNQAMNDSVPVIQAMKTAKEMAINNGDTDLAKQINQDLKGAYVRLDSGKDLNQITYLQDKYKKFMPAKKNEDQSTDKDYPPHLQDLFKKLRAKQAQDEKNNYKITDVTPAGYGPKEKEVKEKYDPIDYKEKEKTLQQIQNNPHTANDEELKKELMRRKEQLLTTKESKTALYTNRLVDMMGKKLGENWTAQFKNSLKS